VLSFALSIGLLLQGLVPAGYMPAPLEQGGWLVQLCPDGLPRSLLASAPAGNDGGHAHHGNHDAAAGAHGSGDARDYCPVGSAFDTVAVGVLATHYDRAAIPPGPAPSGYLPPRISARLTSAQPRAPPIS
jgi:hypothetical protein